MKRLKMKELVVDWDIALLTRSACVITYPCCVIVSNNIVFWIPLSSVILQYLHNYVALQLDNKELTACVYGILCRPSESEQLCPPSPSAAAAASLHGSSAGTHVSVRVSTQWCQPCLRWSDKRALKPSHSVESKEQPETQTCYKKKAVMWSGVYWFIIKLEKRMLCT